MNIIQLKKLLKNIVNEYTYNEYNPIKKIVEKYCKRIYI